MIRKEVRDLNARYEKILNTLEEEYLDALGELQAKCLHTRFSRWKYEIDTKGELASNEYGVLYKYRECQDCGLVERKLDDINDYDSEVKF